MIAMPLLMAGSAWVGEYDGEWRGSVLQCMSGSTNLDLRFFVDDGVVRGAYQEKWPVLNGTIEGHRIKAKLAMRQAVMTVSGSLQSGKINVTGSFSNGDPMGCLGTIKVARIGASQQKRTVTVEKEKRLSEVAAHTFDGKWVGSVDSCENLSPILIELEILAGKIH